MKRDVICCYTTMRYGLLVGYGSLWSKTGTSKQVSNLGPVLLSSPRGARCCLPFTSPPATVHGYQRIYDSGVWRSLERVAGNFMLVHGDTLHFMIYQGVNIPPPLHFTILSRLVDILRRRKARVFTAVVVHIALFFPLLLRKEWGEGPPEGGQTRK